MVSVIIKSCGEPSVTQFTFEHLYKELKDITGSELLIKDEWNILDIKNRFVCFVESDCLVSEGYFRKQIEAFNLLSPRVVILTSSTAVKYWDNKIYGYALSAEYGSSVLPNRKQKTSRPYPVQIGYIPGAIMRTSSLKRLFLPQDTDKDLVYYSSQISLHAWDRGITVDAKHPDGQLGTQVYINPQSTYVTTEDYVNDMGKFDQAVEGQLMTLFTKESI